MKRKIFIMLLLLSAVFTLCMASGCGKKNTGPAMPETEQKAEEPEGIPPSSEETTEPEAGPMNPGDGEESMAPELETEIQETTDPTTTPQVTEPVTTKAPETTTVKKTEAATTKKQETTTKKAQQTTTKKQETTTAAKEVQFTAVNNKVMYVKSGGVEVYSENAPERKGKTLWLEEGTKVTVTASRPTVFAGIVIEGSYEYRITYQSKTWYCMDYEVQETKPEPQKEPEAELCKEMLTYVNKLRKENGLNELVWMEELEEGTMVRAIEIATDFSHDSASKPFEDIWWLVSGENIAAGNSTVQKTYEQWLNSSGHKANMLNPDFKYFCCAVYYHLGKYYWVQIFG